MLIYDGKDADIKKGSLETIREAGVKVLHFDDFIKLGKEKSHAPNHPQPDDVACIMCVLEWTSVPNWRSPFTLPQVHLGIHWSAQGGPSHQQEHHRHQ